MDVTQEQWDILFGDDPGAIDDLLEELDFEIDMDALDNLYLDGNYREVV